MKSDNTFEVILFVILIVGCFSLGFLTNYLFFTPEEKNCETKANVLGLWLPDISYLSNYSGTFICINTDNVKTMKELREIILHETAHEFWARECVQKPEVCLDTFEVIEKYGS